MKYTPLISWLVPVHNGFPFLPLAVESLLQASLPNTEFIFVDDASQDGSFDYLQRWCRGRKKAKVLRVPLQQGVATALNIGLSVCRGKYIARMDSDDVAYPERLWKQMEFMENHPQCIALGSQVRLINSNGKTVGFKQFPTEHNEIVKFMYRYIPLQHSSGMFLASALKAHTYDEKIPLAEDLDLLFRLRKTGEIRNLPQTLLDYRIWNGSETVKHIRKSLVTACCIRRKNLKGRNTLKKIQLLSLQKISKITPQWMIQKTFEWSRLSLKNH